MKAWALFYPHVLPKVIGCPLPTVDFALVQAAREFCRRTAVWKEWAASFVTDGLTQTYSFVLPTGSELVKVTRASVDGDDYMIKGRDALPPDWSSLSATVLTTDTDLDKTLVQISPTQYMLFPFPDAGITVQLEMALQPTLAATTVGDVIYDSYAEELSSGALKRLLSSPKADWFDADGAAVASGEFERAINSAANQDFRQRDKTARRTRPWG
jgi:hypothetical protein